MRKAFTLVELLVVVGLMGMMSTLAISSYSALTRGMNDRAALDVAKTLMDAAVQRANLDRTKIHVYFFDEVLKTDSDMSAGVGSGVAIAVRPVGRVTLVPETGFFCDEFADLDQIYGALEERGDEMSEGDRQESSSAFRLYNMSTHTYTTVREGVSAYEITDRDLELSGEAQGELSGGSSRTWKIYGFEQVENDTGGASFKVGEQYGQEFAVTRLPPGYFFGSSVSMSSASDLGQKYIKYVEISPTDNGVPSVPVYVRRPNGNLEQVGDINQVKDGK